MFAQFYRGMPWTELPLLALMIFLGTFLAVVVRMTVFGKRAELQAIARLPLDDGVAASAPARGEEPLS